MKKILLTLFLTIAVASQASAIVFYFAYTDTASNTDIENTTNGDTIILEFALDNGGSSLISQNWTASDIVSFSVGKPDESFKTVFGPEPIISSSGSFATDASGALTSAPSSWQDNSVTNIISTTSSFTPSQWYVNANNEFYVENGSNNGLDLSNVGNNTNPAFWSVSTSTAFSPVPEPSAAALGLGLIVAAFACTHRKRSA